MTKLVFLSLWNNGISDLEPLRGMTNLLNLSLSGNKIEDISPLASLHNLRTLSLGYRDLMEYDFFYNNVSDLSPLQNLTNLSSLSLVGNRVSNISPLVANPGLGDGDGVSLECNELDLSEGSQVLQHVSELRARGVSVSVEPQRGYEPDDDDDWWMCD
jgi:internalin A